MGIFGGIKKAFGDRDFGERLLAAGAIVNGDFGTAGQLRALGQRRRDEQSEAQAKAQQAEMAVAALVRQGIPEPDARAIVASGAADTVMGQRFGNNARQPYRVEDNAGNVHEMQPDGSFKPIFIDRNPRTYFDPSQNRVVTVPNTYATEGQEPPEILEGIPPGARPIGGAGSNAGGSFRPSRYGWKFP